MTHVLPVTVICSLAIHWEGNRIICLGGTCMYVICIGLSFLSLYEIIRSFCRCWQPRNLPYSMQIWCRRLSVCYAIHTLFRWCMLYWKVSLCLIIFLIIEFTAEIYRVGWIIRRLWFVNLWVEGWYLVYDLQAIDFIRRSDEIDVMWIERLHELYLLWTIIRSSPLSTATAFIPLTNSMSLVFEIHARPTSA